MAGNDFLDGEITNDYDYMVLATPNHDLVQESVAEAIKKYSIYSCKRKIDALEIGIGTGETALKVLSEFPFIKITGIDISPKMIEQARKKLQKNGLLEKVVLKETNVFHELSTEVTPSNTYDVVYSAYTLHNFRQEDRQRLLPQIHRVLKKDGLFVLSDKIAVDDPKEHAENMQWYLNRLEEFFPPEREHAKKELVDHTKFDEQEGIRWTENEVIRDLNSAGFYSFAKTFRNRTEAGFIAYKK